jgi:RNA polymerase sigma factor (sigma-70 family)
MVGVPAPIRLDREVVGLTQSERERKRRFDSLFASYSSDVVAYCSWHAGSATDAQDAVADVFLTVWRRLDDIPTGDAARVWLYATARRVIANQHRSNRRRVALRERLAAEAASAAPATPSSHPDEARVHEALRKCEGVTARYSYSQSGRAFRLPRSRPWSTATRRPHVGACIVRGAGSARPSKSSPRANPTSFVKEDNEHV